MPPKRRMTLVERRARRRELSHRFTAESPSFQLPVHEAHHGVVIAQLSDLHIGAGVPEGRVRAAVDFVNAAKPDLVVLTGDFVTSKRDPIEQVSALLGGLQGTIIAVLGNHDHWSGAANVTRALERLGVDVLQNEHRRVRLRGADFTIIGVDDSTTGHDDVAKAFRGVRGQGHLVLTHTPACAKKLPADRGLLCLSGHTHGGQWDVARLTKRVFALAGQPYYRGRYVVEGNQLYVNRGLGFGRGTRMPRLNAEPEVTLLTLAAE